MVERIEHVGTTLDVHPFRYLKSFLNGDVPITDAEPEADGAQEGCRSGRAEAASRDLNSTAS